LIKLLKQTKNKLENSCECYLNEDNNIDIDNIDENK